MAIIKKMPKICNCVPPLTTDFGPGTIWECDNCKSHWTVQEWSEFKFRWVLTIDRRRDAWAASL